MAEEEPGDGNVAGETEEGENKVAQEVQLVTVMVEIPKVPEQEKKVEEEVAQEEEEEEVRRFRRCQRRKKTEPPIEVLTEVKEEEDEEEDEESEDDVKTVSEYESIYSAVPFEWENQFYEFLDLCDPGTLDNVYQRETVKISFDIYGQTSYLKNCNDLNIPPIVRFYNGLTTAEIDLTFHGLNRKQMYAICKVLEVNPTVETLILKGNPLSTGSCQSLATLLAKNSVITDLDLSGCKIGPEGARMLARGLQRNENIKELNLSKCFIEDEGMSYLAFPLKNNYIMEKIVLSWNSLSGKAADVMGTLFHYNNSISYVDLDNNNLYDPACMKKFCRGLSDNSAVTYLTLKWNALSSAEIGDAIAQFLKRNSSIKCLDLSDNRLDGASVKPLRKGLAGCRSLEILRLARNPLTSEDLEYLLPGVKACRNLKLVDIQETWVRKEFVKSLSKIKQSRNVDVVFEGVYSDYTICGPDYPALLLKRAQFEGMKPKKENAKREFGNLLFMMGDEPVTPDYFMEQVTKFKAKISDELFPELIKQFTVPRGNLVDVPGMRKKYLSLFPDFKPSEEKNPKPEVDEEGIEKKKGEENQEETHQKQEKRKLEVGVQSERNEVRQHGAG